MNEFVVFYKWIDGKDIYVAKVNIGYNDNLIANYYKNGELWAYYQPFIKRDTDIEISEKEFMNHLC